MDEPQGQTEQQGATDGGPVSEGVGHDSAQVVSHSVQRQGVQAFRAEQLGPGGLEVPSFTLLAALNEPEEFAIELKRYADAVALMSDPRWVSISKAMDVVIKDHAAHNTTPPRAA